LNQSCIGVLERRSSSQQLRGPCRDRPQADSRWLYKLRNKKGGNLPSTKSETERLSETVTAEGGTSGDPKDFSSIKRYEDISANRMTIVI